MSLIKLAATEVVSGVSGESERTLRDLFLMAKVYAPCVLFIDDVDAICRKREMAQREMERRIVTQFLACMDGEFLHLFCSVPECTWFRGACRVGRGAGGVFMGSE